MIYTASTLYLYAQVAFMRILQSKHLRKSNTQTQLQTVELIKKKHSHAKTQIHSED